VRVVAPASIDVVLPVRDRAATVGRAIDSVLAQTVGGARLIVVDDGSTDGTADVLASYGTRITVLRQDGAGAYPARNLALRASNAELVAFIDSDDEWLPERLERQLPLLQRPEVALVFGDAAIRDSDRTTYAITAPHRGRVADAFVWGNFISTSTVLVRRAALGAFSELVPLAGDYLAWFRIACRHELDHTDDVVAVYAVHPGGISFDLGASLEARIALFANELASATDPRQRLLLRRMLLHLGLHLAVATVRGRATRSGDDIRAALRGAGPSAGRWLPSFVAHHALQRARRMAA
jgi:glycosyltransferase involved in cell wall biosynthesis